MKIHFENVNINSTTGPNTFGSRLIKGMINLGHKIVNDYRQSDVTCAFIENKCEIPDKHPIVQRLDGIWFKPEEFLTHNSLIKKTYQRSNRVIWQSKFDQEMITFHWGPKKGDVINNGIRIRQEEVKNIYLQDLRRNHDLIFAASANWHRQKRLRENVEIFIKIKNDLGLKCALIIMGNNPDIYTEDPDVYYTGSISHESCLEIFSASDWMIHLAWLDHCPNTVVEALSQNCPVICTNSGGTSEIVKKGGIIIKENTPYNFELTDYDNPYELVLDEFDSSVVLKKKNVENSHLDIETVSKKYEEVFLKTLEEAS